MSQRGHGGGAVAGAAIVLALLAAASCGGRSGGERQAVLDPPPAGPSVAVAFATAAPAAAFTPATSASLDATESMYVVVDWRLVPGDQAARVLLRAPGGTPYFDQVLPLADGTVGLSSVVSAGDTRRMVLRIPVWGSNIERYRETGTWTVSVALQDGDLSGAAQLELE